MGQVVLEVENLKKSFGSLEAVAGISINLKKGECLALLGPNGAGKTTTCEIMEGLVAQDSGSIKIFGLGYRKDRKEILERIGVQLQETSLYKKYTVKETFELFSSFFKSSVSADEMIKRLDLTDKKDSRLEGLSGGLKQRVYLGCALINNPELLFLDEPTTGLDPNARKVVWDLVRTFKEEGKSILLTTHYLEEAENLADRVAIIDQGKIIAKGTPEELIREYCNEDIFSFALSMPTGEKLDLESLEKIQTKLPWLPKENKTGTFEVMVSDATKAMQEVVRAADEFKLEITSLNQRRSTLEDAFVRLTGRNLSNDK